MKAGECPCGGTHPRDSDQLELWQAMVLEERRMPWGGRSPRALTRTAMNPIFKAGAAKSVSELLASDQLELWSIKERGPGYAGAPLLIPLPGG